MDPQKLPKSFVLSFAVVIMISSDLHAAGITGVSSGGVGYVTYSRDANGVNATIGRWDTPYPYPVTGDRAPGLEPDGPSELYIDLNVGMAGGTVSFSYRVQSYDAGQWDWFDIEIESRTGTTPVVTHLGKAGNAYGSYWTTGDVEMNLSLNDWKGQDIRFIFRVQQDGWGDQTVAEIVNFKSPDSCDKLKLEVFSSVQPTIPPKGGPGPQPGGTGPTPESTTLAAGISEPAPAFGCRIEFERPEPVPTSGGHLHDDAGRPVGFINGEHGTQGCTIQEGMTFCAVEYHSRTVSGQEEIRAWVSRSPTVIVDRFASADPGKRATALVTVKMPGLIPMPVSGAGVWRLTGQIGNHPINHYATPQTITRIGAMATDYYEATKTLSGVGIAIGINDMSLEGGGMFDICGTFNISDACINAQKGGHKWHRTGKSVDVDKLGANEDILDDIALVYHGKRHEVTRIHYEFD